MFSSWTFGKCKARGGLNTYVPSRLWPRRSTRWRDPSRRRPSFWRPAPSPRCKWRSRWRRPSSGRRAAGTEVGNPSQPFPHRSSLSLPFPALSLYKNQFQYVGWPPPTELRAAGPPASCFFFYLNFRSEEVWERHILQLFNSGWAKKVVGTERRLFCLREKLWHLFLIFLECGAHHFQYKKWGGGGASGSALRLFGSVTPTSQDALWHLKQSMISVCIVLSLLVLPRWESILFPVFQGDSVSIFSHL